MVKTRVIDAYSPLALLGWKIGAAVSMHEGYKGDDFHRFQIFFVADGDANRRGGVRWMKWVRRRLVVRVRRAEIRRCL
jgi:hypothetical protein